LLLNNADITLVLYIEFDIDALFIVENQLAAKDSVIFSGARPNNLDTAYPNAGSSKYAK
jgi:hypothetical protein